MGVFDWVCAGQTRFLFYWVDFFEFGVYYIGVNNPDRFGELRNDCTDFEPLNLCNY